MQKPEKPTPDFPLFAHDTKRWAKKIGGKLRYFGPWEDPFGALARYQAQFGGEGGAAPRTRKTSKGAKPEKPYADFPLTPHNCGQWCKKIKGKLYYFGTWDDPDGALEEYKRQVDDLQAGRTPQPKTEGITFQHLVNRYLTAREHDVETGELDQRTFNEYDQVCRRVADCIGKTRAVAGLSPDDFGRIRAMFAKRQSGNGSVGLVTLDNLINRLRCVFSWGVDSGLIPTPKYGASFERPGKKALRIERAKKPKRLFTADEVKALIAAAKTPVKAFILLGINCGFENKDCALLRFDTLDLNSGWIDYRRPKTGAERKCHLWPETIEAIEDYLAVRPESPPPELAGYVFLTKYRNLWCQTDGGRDNPITKETAKLLKTLKIKRPGVNFLALRHTFQTIGESSGDIYAVKTIMGHTEDAGDMSPVYREKMEDARLKAVADHVRAWVGFKDTKRRRRVK